MKTIGIWGLLVVILFAYSPASATDRLDTLLGKHIVGYQGWFSCPGDKAQLGWRHWFRGAKPDVSQLVVDQWPDTSELNVTDRCDTGLLLRKGQHAYLFSSENPNVIEKHFAWMKRYGIDGVALQRFDSELRNPIPLKHTNIVMDNVRSAAEAEGRGFFIMYDLSGDDPDIVARVTRDWTALIQNMKLTDSPSYMRHKGKPLVGLWGLGFKDRKIDAAQAEALIHFFRTSAAPATVIGGVPSGWRTLTGDSRAEPAWSDVYRSLDVISPWTVGRFADRVEAARFMKDYVIADMAETKRLKVDYLPVIFPGMSWYNGQKGRVPLNNIPRLCGNFYNSLARLMRAAGARMLYTAMFDEVNEGTAIFKVVTDSNETPTDSVMATLGNHDCRARSDMYLKEAGAITRSLHADFLRR
jgi:hypothetical protein